MWDRLQRRKNGPGKTFLNKLFRISTESRLVDTTSHDVMYASFDSVNPSGRTCDGDAGQKWWQNGTSITDGRRLRGRQQTRCIDGWYQQSSKKKNGWWSPPQERAKWKHHVVAFIQQWIDNGWRRMWPSCIYGRKPKVRESRMTRITQNRTFLTGSTCLKLSGKDFTIIHIVSSAFYSADIWLGQWSGLHDKASAMTFDASPTKPKLVLEHAILESKYPSLYAHWEFVNWSWQKQLWPVQIMHWENW